jgi:hypothetical protein
MAACHHSESCAACIRHKHYWSRFVAIQWYEQAY